MVEDLVRWLGAQLDEDERIVNEANTSPEMVTGIPRSYAEAPVAVHIATFADPARVLREITARRRTIAQHTAAVERMDQAMRDNDTSAYQRAMTMEIAFRAVLRNDAAVYSDRPGYRMEWRP